jgi:YD repeat-containing protein
MDDLIEEQTPLGEMSYNYDAAHRLLSTTVDGEAPTPTAMMVSTI